MLITRVRVRRFRALYDVDLPVDQTSIFIGPNSAGKSSALQAVHLFFSPDYPAGPHDCYDREQDCPITIALTFGGLREHEIGALGRYVHANAATGEPQVVVERELAVVQGRASSAYFGHLPRHPEFAALRRTQSAADKRTAYEAIRRRDGYGDLPGWTTAVACEAALRAWEEIHPDRCDLDRDGGDTIGCGPGKAVNLRDYLRPIFVPAVRDAVDEVTDSRGSLIQQLADLVVRSRVDDDPELREMRERFFADYADRQERVMAHQREALSRHVNEHVKQFVPQVDVELRWSRPALPALPLPKVEVVVREGAFAHAVGSAGHGVQRSIVLAMLRLLATPPIDARQTGTAAPAPDLLLLIEEPELYQHPLQARNFARVLDSLGGRSEAGAPRTQVLYATHSHLFVQFERFERVRRFRRDADDPNRAGRTTVAYGTLAEVKAWLATGEETPHDPMPDQVLRRKLVNVMKPALTEALFADFVVVAEGEGDVAAIQGMAEHLGWELLGHGVAVVDAGGGGNIAKVVAVLRALNIPTYVIWDSDTGNGNVIRRNRQIAQLVGAPPEDHPVWVRPEGCCIDGKLEVCLAREFGEEWFEREVDELAREFEKEREGAVGALKSGVVVAELIRRAYAAGKRCETLEQVLHHIGCRVGLPPADLALTRAALEA